MAILATIECIFPQAFHWYIFAGVVLIYKKQCDARTRANVRIGKSLKFLIQIMLKTVLYYRQ
jgi:hypothetical protein